MQALALCALLSSCVTTTDGQPVMHPSVSVPVPVAEGKGEAEPGDLSPRDAPTAASAPPQNARQKHGSLPDPTPLRQREQYEYRLHYVEGKVSVAGVVARHLAEPLVTARQMGRFAIELWLGKELIERVRFDFPLLAADGADLEGIRSKTPAPSFGDGLTASRTILVPAAERATYALLVDRKTGEETELPWPPAVDGVPAP